MGLRIQNNIAAMNAHRNLTVSDAGLAKSLERLSSGYRINKAADDAAGLAISQRFRAQIASLKVAQRNVSEANALLQVAEGGMDKIGEILTRMKELATQAASANVGGDITKLDNEYDALVAEIDRIAQSTKYADTELLDGSFAAQSFQIGYSSQAYDRLTLTLTDVQSATLGVAVDDISTSALAQTALDTIETAISTLADARSGVGAYQNRLGYAAANVAITVENFQAAESVIRDVDMAAEMTTFTKNQILLQAGTAMLAQANLAPQQILALFS